MKVLLGTRKGLMILEKQGSTWVWHKPLFAGVKVSLAVYDPHNHCVWAALKHGHWGPKLHLSKDGSASFTEVTTPSFPEGSEINLLDTWAITSDTTGRVYLGTEPAAVFHSDDLGATWQINQAMHAMPKDQWFDAAAEAPCLHSIIVDPSNEKRLLVGISVAGVLASDDHGETWQWRNKGSKAHYLPDPEAEMGQDPHALAAHPKNKDIIWQQNHCGLFASKDGAQTWVDYSSAKGVLSAFGWAIAIADDAVGSIYTVPALSDESRITLDEAVVVQVSRDGGLSWSVQRNGLPQTHSWDICYRHGLDASGETVVFGTTTGNLYLSENAGNAWTQISANMPPIYSVRIMP